jgi:hypothetical protein
VPHPDQPIPSAVRMPVHGDSAAPTSRRAFLGGLLGVAGAGALGAGSLATLTGCDILRPSNPPADPVPPALQGFLAATSALGDRYDATLTAVSSLPPRVGQIRDAHRAHARALAQAIGALTPAPSGSSSGGAPTDHDQALAALVAAEKAAHQEAVAECMASTPRFAALLGSIAAARATHLVALA